MTIRFSRHAKSRMRLYGVEKGDVELAIDRPDAAEKEGARTSVLKAFPGRFSEYPLKVVYEIRPEELLIVTVYPLKKRLWR